MRCKMGRTGRTGKTGKTGDGAEELEGGYQVKLISC
jgi:hypothetical protein